MKIGNLHGYRHAWRITFFLILFLSWFEMFFAAPSPVWAQYEEITSRTFAVHYRSIDEFIALATALLSKKGKVTKSTVMNAMVIQDYPFNLTRVDSLLSRFDTPPHQLRVSIRLFFGSMVTDEEQMMRNPSIESLLKNRFNFNRIELLDEGLLMTEESAPARLELANGQYIIAFLPIYLPLKTPAIELRNFRVITIKRSMGGEERKELLSTAVTMIDEDEHIVGAMQYGMNGETLLVIVRMEILDSSEVTK